MRDLAVSLAHEHLNRVRVRSRYLSAACPFHKGGMERKPSFYISLEDGSWGCSSCGAHGKSIKGFLYRMDIRGTRADAQIELAEKEAKENSDLYQARRQKKARSSYKGEFTLPDAVLGAYDWCPASLVRAGFTEETLRRHEVGYDRKRDRITFPIRDIFGNLVGISGRQPEGMQPKYKIYSGNETVDGKAVNGELGETFPDYSSSTVRDHIYGAHSWYSALNKTSDGQVILVEGYKADLWIDQCGWEHVGGIMGTAMTAQQERIIRSLGADVWVFMDNDKPGRRASKSICWRLADSSFRVYECHYPEGHEGDQPDDMTTDEIEETLATATRVGARNVRLERRKGSGQEGMAREGWQQGW